MPLLPGKKNIGKNIKKEMAIGRHRRQAIAIALSVARKSGVKIPKQRRMTAGEPGASKVGDKYWSSPWETKKPKSSTY